MAYSWMVYATSICNKNNIKIFNMSNKEYIKTIPFIDYMMNLLKI